MRKIVLYILLLSFFVACKDSYDESLGFSPSLAPRYLSVSPNSLSYGAKPEGAQRIDVLSEQTSWTLDGEIDWLLFSATSGTSSAAIDITATENKLGGIVRTGLLFLVSNENDYKFEFPISVTQDGAVPAISLSATNVELSGSAHSETITVTSNCSWEAVSSAAWVSVSQSDNSINFSISSNDGDSYRKATITVSNDSEGVVTSQSIDISQAPAAVNATTEDLNFGNNASTISIEITAESSWTSTTSDSWIEVTPTSGEAGKHTIEVSVAPNTSIEDRNGFVIFSIGGNNRVQIPIVQRGIYIDVEDNKLQFSAAEGSDVVKVLSNTSWSVSTTSDWISLDCQIGEKDGEVTVSVSENNSTSNRSGVIQLTQPGLDLSTSITVNQNGKTFDINTTLLNFEDKQSTQEVEITTDGTWSATTEETWISLSPTSDTNNSTLSVTVLENTSNDERSGEVLVEMADKTETINISQQGKYFTISSELLRYTSRGGEIAVEIGTNDTWTAKLPEDCDWLTLSQADGDTSADLIITASDNPSVNSREATVVFESKYHQDVKISVTQESRYLTVNTGKVLFYAKGGDSDVIKISTDGEYEIKSSGSWFSVETTDGGFTVTAPKNNAEEPRFGSITISLTDLVNSTYSLELEVIQLNEGGSFILNGFEGDENYDDEFISYGDLEITGFGDDENLDSTFDSSVGLSITRYSTDENWN